MVKKYRVLAGITFLLLLVPFAWLIVHLFVMGVPDLPVSGDGALLEMSTRDLFSRGILLGPYSRFFFYHPGPFYFAVRFPFYMLAGQRSSSFLLATVFIVTASLYGIWKVFRKQAGNPGALGVTAVLALMLVVLDKTVWLSEWNPYIIIFPVFLFIAASASFASGESKHIFAVVLTGSLVAQTHISAIPLLGSVFILSVVFLVYPWFVRKGSSAASGTFRWKHIALGAGLFLVLWLPPLYQQFSAEKGNMTMIQEFFQENNPEISSVDAYRGWTAAVTGFELDPLKGFIRANGLGRTLPDIVVAVRLLLLSLCYGLMRRNSKSGFLCSMSLMLIVCHAVAFHSATQVRGPLNDYLLQWMILLGPLSWITVLLSGYVLLRGKIPVTSVKTAWYAVPVLLMVLSAFIVRDVSGLLRDDLDPSWVHEIAVQEITEDLKPVLAGEPDKCFILNLHTTDCWIEMAGIMNTLEKQGYNIVMGEMPFFVDTPVPEGMETRTLHLGYINEELGSPPNLVSRHDRIGILLE